MAIKRTNPHRTYSSPQRGYVNSVATDLQVNGGYSYEIVKDIANYLSFPEDEREGSFVEPSTWEFDIDDDNLSASDLMNKKAERKAYHKNIQDFIRHLDFDNIGGETPVEKALNVVSYLNGKSKGNCSGEKDENGENQIPIFNPGNGASMKNVAKDMEDTMELIQKIEPGSFTAKAMDVKEGVLAGVNANHISNKDIEVLKRLAVFNAKGAIKAEKRVTKREVDSSDVKKTMNMSRYSEVGKIAPTLFAMPNFDHRFATMELPLEKFIEIKESKQILVLMIDDSGSMNTPSKVAWIKALLLNRCEEVIKGNAELYICTFEVQLDPHWIVVKNRQDAENVWDKFSKFFGLNRGGTDMVRSLEEAMAIIDSGEVPISDTQKVKIEGHRPQICIINDGQDSVQNGYIPRMVTHGFILDGRHDEMRKFCVRSGGIYEEFR